MGLERGPHLLIDMGGGSIELILAHDGDPIHPLSSARRLADALPNARLWVAPRPNYLQEHPEAAVDPITQPARQQSKQDHADAQHQRQRPGQAAGLN